jgi:hypothetical protein
MSARGVRAVACPCCGAAVAVPVFAEALAGLPPMQRAIVDLVQRRPGISRAEIAGALYVSDPNGGPEWAVSSVGAMIAKANRRLRAAGFELRRPRGAWSGYRVFVVDAVDMDQLEDAA